MQVYVNIHLATNWFSRPVTSQPHAAVTITTRIIKASLTVNQKNCFNDIFPRKRTFFSVFKRKEKKDIGYAYLPGCCLQ